MTIIPEKYVERLIDVSARKVEILKDMLGITIKQSEAITEDTTEKLDSLIAEKQKRIDSINKLDDEFSVYYERLKFEMKVKSLDELQAGSVKGIKELQLCIGGIMKLMHEISDLEKLNNEKAGKILEDIGKEIRKLNQSKKVSNAYVPAPMQIPSYFIDKKK